MRRHYSATELLAYLAGNDEIVDLNAVGQHIESCDQCGTRLDDVRWEYQVISDPATWHDAVDDPPGGTAFFAEYHRRMREDANRAAEILDSLSSHPLDTWVEHLSSDLSQPLMDALAQQATAKARGCEESQPTRSLALLDFAETVLALVPQETFAKETLGSVWRERANVLLVLGDYSGALEALDRAAPLFEKSIVATFDLAFIAWGRASVHFEMGDYARALFLVREATPVFERFGDVLRAAQTRVLEAGALYEQGLIEHAESIWKPLPSVFEKYGDRASIARIYGNLACCRLQRDHLIEAEALARRAIGIYEECGLTTEIIRTRWALAKVLVRRGESDSAIRSLDRIAGEFAAAGLQTDAAEVRLDIVEELLERGNFERAARIARDLVATFAKANARLSVVKALAYLREAVEGSNATPSLVRAVRHVVTHPDRSFIPPS